MTERLEVNPDPLAAVSVKGQVPQGTAEWLRGLSRADRLRIWLAVGGTQEDFDAEHPEEA